MTTMRNFTILLLSILLLAPCVQDSYELKASDKQEGMEVAYQQAAGRETSSRVKATSRVQYDTPVFTPIVVSRGCLPLLTVYKRVVKLRKLLI